MNRRNECSGPIYVLRLRVLPGRDGICGLKAILKIALRRYGLRALEVREVGDGGAMRREEVASCQTTPLDGP
jgi:hypothetical protein